MIVYKMTFPIQLNKLDLYTNIQLPKSRHPIYTYSSPNGIEQQAFSFVFYGGFR